MTSRIGVGPRSLSAALVVLALPGCGGSDDDASGKNSGDIPRIELKYPTVEQEIRDCKINGGHPQYCEIRERCLASGETYTFCGHKAERFFEERNLKQQQ